MDNDPPQPSRRRRRKEARPQELLAAAAQVFLEQGFAAAKVEDIAARSGVAKGTVYLYFKSKEEIFEALVRENIAPIFHRVQETAQSFPGTTSELIGHLVASVYRELIEVPEKRVVVRILIAEGPRFPQLVAYYHSQILAPAEQLLGQIIRRGVSSGEFRACPAVDHPKVLIGPAIMAAVWKMTFEPVSPLDTAGFMRAHVDLVLNGLLVRPREP